MVRTLQKIGNSKGIVLTRDMREHLGNPEAVDIQFASDGSIRLTAAAENPRRRLPPHNISLGFEQAVDIVTQQYDQALQKLADN